MMAEAKTVEEKEVKKEEQPVEKVEIEVKAKVEDTKADSKEEKGETKKVEEKQVKKEEKPKKERKEKKEEKKVDIVSENVYTVPLTKVHHTKPIYRRSKKAITAIVSYLKRHTKSENIKIDDGLNKHVWSRGTCKPPRRVQIKAVKDSEGKVVASLLK
jgi:large subunit ribosomal protein L31e